MSSRGMGSQGFGPAQVGFIQGVGLREFRVQG